MRRSHMSYCFLGSFLAAMFFLQWYQRAAYPWQVWLILGIFGILGFFGFFGIFGHRPSLRSPLRVELLGMTLASIIGISVALLLVARTTHVRSADTVDFYATGAQVTLQGFVADDPDRRALKTNYTVEVERLHDGTRPKAVRGRVLVSLPAGTEPLQYGDVFTARGALEAPKATEDFRYDNYLSRIEVYSLLKNPEVKRAGKNKGNVLLRGLFGFRQSMEKRINLLWPEPHASLLAGLLLGSRRGIPADLQEDFKNTGLTHLVAISGYNITMLITVMGTLLFWLPLKWRFFPSVLLIIGFTLLTGASASAVRAAVMGILGLLCTQLGRIQTTRLTTLWAAAVMVGWNPKLLWYDAGFALSFLALIGILEVAPLLRPHLRFLPEFLGIRESLCLTLSAQMLASAWIFYLFGELSLIAPLSNLLAPPLVPAATLLGLGSVVLSSGFLPVGHLSAAIAWLPLQGITGIAHTLGALPFASLTLKGFPMAGIVGYYGCVAAWAITKNFSPTRIEESSSLRSTVAV